MKQGYAKVIHLLSKPKLIELVEQNMNGTEISEQMNCSRAYISKLAKEYGIKLPRKRRTFGHNTSREKIRKEQLEKDGWKVLKQGWPDFLKYKHRNGKLIIRAEEVKHDDEDKLTTLGLKPEQQELFNILARILPIDLIHISPDGKTKNKREFYRKTSNVLNHVPSESKPKPKPTKKPRRSPPEPSKDALFYRRLGELTFESKHKKDG